MNKKLIGVDLGGTTIKFAILTDQGEIQQKWSLRTNILDEGSHIVPDIIESINHHIDLWTAASLSGSAWGRQERLTAKKERSLAPTT